MEAVCPACMGLRLLAEHAPALAGLTVDDTARDPIPLAEIPVAEIPADNPAGEPVRESAENPGTRRR